MSRIFHQGFAMLFASAALVAVPARAQTMSVTRSLSFGAFAAGNGGTVSISTASARSAFGDVTLLTSSKFEFGSAALFSLTGPAATFYNVTVPETALLDRAGGGGMMITSFSISPSSTGLLTGGAQLIAVGATLKVPPHAGVGEYSGTFDVTVIYD